MKKILLTIAAGSLMSVAGLASAAEPVQLTDTQMDKVAAGGYSIDVAAGGYAEAVFGRATSVTKAKTSPWGSSVTSYNSARGFLPYATSEGYVSISH